MESWLMPKRYLAVFSAVGLLFLGFFAAVSALDVPVFVDPLSAFDAARLPAALIGFGLLIADVALPVPSSVVMTAHGALFGVLLGAVLSLAGSVAATLTAFGVGRVGGRSLQRLVPADERERADEFLEARGAFAIVISRPLPILAETVAIAAGASSMTWRAALAAAIAGSLPIALLYALAGAVAASFGSTALVFGVVALVAAAAWFGGPRLSTAAAA
jgi:uncharacterized membrane protein YdjX (TVP38/TMEM64 family)